MEEAPKSFNNQDIDMQDDGERKEGNDDDISAIKNDSNDKTIQENDGEIAKEEVIDDQKLEAKNIQVQEEISGVDNEIKNKDVKMEEEPLVCD